jgi:small subunit ribosomal protein S16
LAVKIRLRRVGARKRPFYRLVVADARSPRDGRFIEAIGTYDPLQEPALVKVDAEKVLLWISKGAKPTDIARQLLIAEGVLEHTGPKFEKVEKGPKLSKKQVAKARAAEAAAAEPAPEPVAEETTEAAVEAGPVVETDAEATPEAEVEAAPAEEPQAAAEADVAPEAGAEAAPEAETEPVAEAAAETEADAKTEEGSK